MRLQREEQERRDAIERENRRRQEILERENADNCELAFVTPCGIEKELNAKLESIGGISVLSKIRVVDY